MKHNDIKTWVAQQDWSKSIQQIADETGVQYYTVRKRARDAGINYIRSKRGRKPGYHDTEKRANHEAWDWSINDASLGRLHNCSREYARQLRKKLNKPKSPNFKQRTAL